jgi:hypothetical protein
MRVSLRLVCLTGLLMSALAMPATADQGRGDHDTPAMERQSDPISPRLYNTRNCRTDDYGWVVCRDRDGQWWRVESRQPYRGYTDPDSVGDWIGRLLRM